MSSGPEIPPFSRNDKFKTAGKLLPSCTSYKPTQLPVLKFKERNEILDYLGYRHITGIKQWSSLAKAKYLKELRERKPDMSFKELAKSIGSRAKKE